MKYINLAILSLAFIAIGCEENPVGESRVDSPNSSISGAVAFDHSNVSQEGVFVWLDGFDMYTFTDENGRFEFILPPPAAQANPKGVSGAFEIFYYIANFHLGSTPIYTQNGNFLYSGGEFNSNGELREKKRLFQKLETRILVHPSTFHSENINVIAGKTDFLLRVDVTLRAIKDSVVIFYPGIYQDIFSPLMFRNIETGEVKVISSTVAGFVDSDHDTVDTQPVVRTLAVPIFPTELGKGTFEVIPFIRVEGSEIPEGIKRELDLQTAGPGEEYLRIPHLRSGSNRYFTLQ